MEASARKRQVLLAGETWTTITTHIKGVDYFTQAGYGEGVRWLRRALEGRFEFHHLPNHHAPEQFPSTLDDLARFDVLILSDIGSNTLLLHPDTTTYSKVTVNRLEIIREFVHEGGGLLMVGGYMSFQGIEGKARYGGTPVEEVLPVRMLPGDDRVEAPQGFRPRATNEGRAHAVLAGIPEEFPVMLFRNAVEPKPEGVVLLHDAGAPVLVVWEQSRGRAAAFTPDAAPHGATPEFLEWQHFDRFWSQLVSWLAKEID
jgi:uncharacterized membrane protein